MKSFKEWVEQEHQLDEGLLSMLGTGGRGILKGGKWVGKKAVNLVVTAIYGPYKILANAYGKPAALAILAGSLGLHVMFPAFAAFPSSILLGAAPGIITADAVKLLRGKETLIAQGIEELKKLDKAKIASLFKRTRQQIEQSVEQGQATPQPEAA